MVPLASRFQLTIAFHITSNNVSVSQQILLLFLLLLFSTLYLELQYGKNPTDLNRLVVVFVLQTCSGENYSVCQWH